MKPKFFKQRGWWTVRAVLNEPKLKGVVIVGRARSVRAAWNDYSRKYNWYKRGCPGMPIWYTPNKEKQHEKDEHEAVREVGHGQEGRQERTRRRQC